MFIAECFLDFVLLITIILLMSLELLAMIRCSISTVIPEFYGFYFVMLGSCNFLLIHRFPAFYICHSLLFFLSSVITITCSIYSLLGLIPRFSPQVLVLKVVQLRLKHICRSMIFTSRTMPTTKARGKIYFLL